MGVNNLPRVATRQCAGRESNLRPLDHKFKALLLHYRATEYRMVPKTETTLHFYPIYRKLPKM